MKITISSAVSIDGKLAGAERKQLRLSSEEDRAAVDRLRAEHDALLVGSTTLAHDDPSLELRSETHKEMRSRLGLSRQPLKVAISKSLDLPDGAALFSGEGEKLIFTTSAASDADVAKLRAICEIVVCGERVSVDDILRKLSEKGISSLLVEGGGKTNALFLAADVVDRIRLAVAPTVIGEADAPAFADGQRLDAAFRLERTEEIGGMAILHYARKSSG